MIKIIIRSPIHSQILEGKDELKDLLSFSAEYYRRTQRGSIRKEYKKSLIQADSYIYTGFLPLIRAFCERNNLAIQVDVSPESLALEREVRPNLTAKLPTVDGFEKLRPEQERQVKAAIEKRRGYVVAPMGSGKTILFMSILKHFEKYNCLVIVPGKSLMGKSLSDLRGFDFKEVHQLGDGQKEIKRGISVATMQTLRTLNLEELSDFWSVIIIDEAHLALKNCATLEQILSKLLAAIRYGFTATYPKNHAERSLTGEGLIGPIISELTFKEAEKLEITVKPKIKLIPVSVNPSIKALKKYPEIYEEGIIKNKMRNRAIIFQAKKFIAEGKSVLVFSSEKSLKHGEILLEMAKNVGLNGVYVRGETETSERDEWLQALKKKDLKLVICTRVWREGTNAPSLDCLILAKGGQAIPGTGGDESLLQTVGRVMRKSKDKIDGALVVDFLDPYRYLAEHSISRIALYLGMNWEIIN